MANLLNHFAVLTLNFRTSTLESLPFQVYKRAGQVIQPAFGLQRKRPTSGQVWPRPETPQRDKLGVA